MILIPDGVRRSSEAEIKAFDATCQRLGGFNPDISFEWVEGFLAALAAGPRLPELEQWLPRLCGDAFERAFADPPDADQARRSLQLRLKVLCEQLDPAALMDDPQALRLDPLMTEWTDADREQMVQTADVSAQEAQSLQTGAVWAEGFLDGVEAFPELWVEPADEESAESFGIFIDQIAALMIPPDEPAYAEHLERYYRVSGSGAGQRADLADTAANTPAESVAAAAQPQQPPPTREELVAEACYAAQELRLYWVHQAPKPVTRRVEATPGRNDACPCGSGKKYKKCHGAAA